ncbi:MAG: hypothetical protein PF447_14240, partial [Spirochaetaceae bacterium]|nr:hypothetical protein [Spirochaetaceae bacterium]
MLINVKDIETFLERPYPLIIAGNRSTLEKVPPGNWIAGTVPFVIENRGEELQDDLLEITPIPSSVSEVKIKSYTLDNIHQI